MKLSREYCQRAVAELGQDHLRTAITLDRHAQHCEEAGLVDEAIKAGNTALGSYWSSVGPDNSYAKGCLRRQSEMLLKKGALEVRLALLRDALRVCDQQLGPLHELTLYRAEACIVALNDMNRRQEGAALGEAWLERVRQRDGSLPGVSKELLREYSLTLRLLNQPVQAEMALRELLAMMDREKPDTLQRFADLSNLAETLINQQRAAEALQLLREVIQVFEERGQTAAALAAKALPLAKKRLTEAEQALARQKTAGR